MIRLVFARKNAKLRVSFRRKAALKTLSYNYVAENAMQGNTSNEFTEWCKKNNKNNVETNQANLMTFMKEKVLSVLQSIDMDDVRPKSLDQEDFMRLLITFNK